MKVLDLGYIYSFGRHFVQRNVKMRYTQSQARYRCKLEFLENFVKVSSDCYIYWFNSQRQIFPGMWHWDWWVLILDYNFNEGLFLCSCSTNCSYKFNSKYLPHQTPPMLTQQHFQTFTTKYNLTSPSPPSQCVFSTPTTRWLQLSMFP